MVMIKPLTSWMSLGNKSTMNILYFTNPGEIDIRSATVAGLNAKENTATAIGFFGTGLKYAIACILRWGGSISIWSGMTEYKFELVDLDFRGKSFQQIAVRKPGEPLQELGFTTEYGKTWKPWQVFRELYSNALDENGTVSLSATPEPGVTTIVINCTEVYDQYPSRDFIILPKNKTYILESNRVKIANGNSSELYYKGVRVYPLKTFYTYNIYAPDIKLTEDRTLTSAYTAQADIAQAVMLCNDVTVIENFLSAPDQFVESEIAIYDWYNYSPVFLDVAVRFWRQSPAKYSRLREFIRKHYPSLLVPEELEMTSIQTKQLDRAKQFINKMGFDCKNYKISIRNLGEHILGRAQTGSGEIFLSPRVFEQGTKQVLSTLYEEVIHIETGKEDCNYDMQTFLFDKIITMYEEHVFKEPI